MALSASLAIFCCASPSSAQLIIDGATSAQTQSNTSDITAAGDAIRITTTGVGSSIDLSNVASLTAGEEGIKVLTIDMQSAIDVINQGPIAATRVGILGASLGSQSGIGLSQTGAINSGWIGVLGHTNGAGSPLSVTVNGNVAVSGSGLIGSVIGAPSINANGAFNGGTGNTGAFNGLGNTGGSSGDNNTGAFNGNLNGAANNGNNNVGAFNGNWNGNSNTGTGNGTNNGSGNTGVLNGNWNGNDNSGNNNGTNNGNNSTGVNNGNSNGNGNTGNNNGNNNGNANNGANNGNGNGNSGTLASAIGNPIASIGVFGQTLGANSALSMDVNGDVTAGDFGLFGLTIGSNSHATISADGTVQANYFGLFGLTIGSGSNLTMSQTGSVTSSGYGIFGASINGMVKTDIGGSVVGGDYGAFLSSGAGTELNVNAGGSLTATSYLAVRAEGAAAVVNNYGLITGYFELTDNSDTFNIFAGGTLRARGTSSDFGSASDTLNNYGTLLSIDGDFSLLNLEQFNNLGLTSTVNDMAGSSLTTSGDFFGGSGSRLAVDAFLASPGEADVVKILGNASGSTIVEVNNTNPAPTPNFLGIPIVEVTGTTDEDDFNLDGPLNAGLFAWDLFLDTTPATHDQHELVTVGLGQGAFETPMAVSAAQDLWYMSSASPWLDRQADLGTCFKDTQAAASGAGSHCDGPVATWLKVQVASADRSDSTSYTAAGRTYNFGLGYDLDFGGIMGGIEVGDWEAISNDESAILLGLMAGYIGADTEFNGGTDWAFRGPTVGAYATYVGSNFYIDALVKADLLHVDIDGGSLGGDASTYAASIGGRIDAGYQVALGDSVFVEPQGMVGLVDSDFDTTSLFGGTVNMDGRSLRGRAGLRAGVTMKGDTWTVVPDATISVWHEFDGENAALVTPPSFAATRLLHDAGETSGEAAIGISALSTDSGWSAFARGRYKYSQDSQEYAARGGFRYAW